MFKKVLVPVPTEQFPQLAIERAARMKELFESEIYLSYIIEKNVFDEFSGQVTNVLTEKEAIKFEKMMVKQHENMARKVVLKEAEKVLGSKIDDFSVHKGSFSDTVLDDLEEKGADLILMEYDSFNLLKYRIMDRSPIPVWIEKKKGPVKKIGLFCTNLSPNKRSPIIARRLKRELKAKLSSFFICDPKGKECEDDRDMISSKHRLKWTEISDEKVDSFIYRKAREEDFDLIILGRIRKRGYFHMRSKFAKRTSCSVLLVN
ncbi:MAG: universal stress protein [Candidatus Thermoplasmatota archaeon]|nr:universal stress protein [Candidatus Thermoplasmatota archaeon]